MKPLRHEKIQKYQLGFLNIKPNEFRNTVITDWKKINHDVSFTKYNDDDLRRARNMLKGQQEELFVVEGKNEIWILYYRTQFENSNKLRDHSLSTPAKFS